MVYSFSSIYVVIIELIKKETNHSLVFYEKLSSTRTPSSINQSVNFVDWNSKIVVVIKLECVLQTKLLTLMSDLQDMQNRFLLCIKQQNLSTYLYIFHRTHWKTWFKILLPNVLTRNSYKRKKNKTKKFLLRLSIT